MKKIISWLSFTISLILIGYILISWVLYISEKNSTPSLESFFSNGYETPS